MILDSSFCDQSGVLYVVMIIKYFITIVKTVAPLILIYGAMKDLFKVVTKPDEVKKVVPSVAKRLVAALAIFFIPTIVNFAINDLAETDNSSFASCSTNANIEYIKALKEKEEQERIDRINNRDLEAQQGAERQKEKNAEDDDQEDNANEYHKKKHEERERNSNSGNNSGSNNGGSGSNGSGSNNASNGGTNGDSSGNGGDGSASYGEGESSKRARKTVTVNGRTYDQYVQLDFKDVKFDGENIATAGCSAVAFTQAASGFDRDITVWDGAELTTERTFVGIINALNSKNIPYSGPLFYDSNDNDEDKIQEMLSTVREHFKQGKPVIALITKDNKGERKYCAANHFITIYGEDAEGNALIGNSKVGDKGSLEEIIRYYMPGIGKGILLVG